MCASSIPATIPGSAREGQSYLRDGVKRVWLNDDLQSFTPTRFMPPALMGFTGRALVIDPDVFAATDVWALLSRDMGGKAILCRMRSGPKGLIDKCFASSVMLLDCAQLKHWDVERRFNAMFDFTQDYQPWVCLKDEPRDSIGFFEPEWNDFDHFTAETRMLRTPPAARPSPGRPACRWTGGPPSVSGCSRPPPGCCACVGTCLGNMA